MTLVTAQSGDLSDLCGKDQRLAVGEAPRLQGGLATSSVPLRIEAFFPAAESH